MNALEKYILSTTEESPAFQAARADAEEYGLPAPDPIQGALLATLAVGADQAIAVAPAGLVGMYILQGLGQGQLTCIDPEAEHQRAAKKAFAQAGFTGRYRFLPSRPLEVMGRLSPESYQLVYGEVHPLDLGAFIEAAWPLITTGGRLVIANSLLDGTVGDPERTDRETEAARHADAAVLERDDAVVARLPLGSGLTVLTKQEAR